MSRFNLREIVLYAHFSADVHVGRTTPPTNENSILFVGINRLASRPVGCSIINYAEFNHRASFSFAGTEASPTASSLCRVNLLPVGLFHIFSVFISFLR